MAWSRRGGDGPAWLLLPALSTISSRREWEPFADAPLERDRQRQDGADAGGDAVPMNPG